MYVVQKTFSFKCDGYGEHSVSLDRGAWYPQARRFFPRMENQYWKNNSIYKSRTKECFNDYFPFLLKRKKKWKLKYEAHYTE